MWQKLAAVPIDNLLLIAGLFLLILLATAWGVQRRKEPTAVPASRIWRGARYGWRLATFALSAFILIGGAVLVYVDYQMVASDIAPAPSIVTIPDELTIPVEEIRFPSDDGLTLTGWFAPSQNGATIILLHGYSSNRASMSWHAQTLYDAGFGILMYDERASGESEGDRRSFGWEDPVDVAGALTFLNGRPETKADQIGIAGCSIGGQIALQGAAYSPEIGAVWADGPSVIRAKDTQPPHNWATVFLFLSGYIVDWMYTNRSDIPPPAAMLDIIGTIAPRPVVLVSGGKPHPFFGEESLRVSRFAEYAGENSALWVIDEAYHCDGPAWQPEEYAQRMVHFFLSAFELPVAEVSEE